MFPDNRVQGSPGEVLTVSPIIVIQEMDPTRIVIVKMDKHFATFKEYLRTTDPVAVLDKQTGKEEMTSCGFKHDRYEEPRYFPFGSEVNQTEEQALHEANMDFEQRAQRIFG